MTVLTEGRLRFSFPPRWDTSQYDRWQFYRDTFQHDGGGQKAVDVLTVDPPRCAWLLEVTDYRGGVAGMINLPKAADLPKEAAQKAHDTMAGLRAASTAATDPREKAAATAALVCARRRFVLHLEQPAKHSKLFPRVFDPATVTQSLKRLVKTIDPHPRVVDVAGSGNLPWTVERLRHT